MSESVRGSSFLGGSIHTRRTVLGSLGSIGVLGPSVALGNLTASDTESNSWISRIADEDWKFSVDTRLQGDLDPSKTIHGFNRGLLYSVREGEAVRPLFGYEVFSSIRLVPQGDGTIDRLCREVVFYRDLSTGKLMDDWENPWTGERVRVVDVANDPINFVRTKSGTRVSKNPDKTKDASPLGSPVGVRREWLALNDDLVGLETDTHLYYESFLTPEKWPRESPGRMTRVSEYMRYCIRREDLENESSTHIPHAGTWTRVTPWLPWMLMDQAPGHCVYQGMFSTRYNLSSYPDDVLDRLHRRYPKYLSAPTEWSEPSYSSLEHYAMEQEPAPPRR